MPQLPEFDRSPAARAIMAEATQAGVTRECIGTWMNFARRYAARGNAAEAAKCARKALAIHAEWGARHAVYEMPPGVVAQASALAEPIPAKAISPAALDARYSEIAADLTAKGVEWDYCTINGMLAEETGLSWMAVEDLLIEAEEAAG